MAKLSMDEKNSVQLTNVRGGSNVSSSILKFFQVIPMEVITSKSLSKRNNGEEYLCNWKQNTFDSSSRSHIWNWKYGSQSLICQNCALTKSINAIKAMHEEMGKSILRNWFERQSIPLTMLGNSKDTALAPKTLRQDASTSCDSDSISQELQKNELADKVKKQQEEEKEKPIISLAKTNTEDVGEASYVPDTPAHSSIVSVNTPAAVERILGPNSAISNEVSKDELGHTRSKTVSHGSLARTAPHALKGLERYQALDQGQSIPKQAATVPHRMQASVKVQARGRAGCASAIDNQNTQSRFDHKNHVQKLEAGWCHKVGSVDEILDKGRRRQEGAAKRERARSYAFTHQWQPHSRINCKQSARHESDRANKGSKGLCLDQAKMDRSESISSNTLDPSMDRILIHNNSKKTHGRGGNHCVANAKECSIGSTSQSKRTNSLTSLQKATRDGRGSSSQSKANQEAKGKKPALIEAENRSTKKKQTKYCDQTGVEIPTIGKISKKLL